MRPLLAILFIASLVGCASGAPPTAFERAAYYITTNWVPEVRGNIVLSNNVITGTNYFTQMVAYPHYEPRPQVEQAIAVGGAVATSFGAPWVVPLLGLLSGLYVWWAEFRNSRKKKLSTTLGQNIETAREIFKALPGGAAMDYKFKEEIKSQQVDAGVKLMATEVAEEQVDTVKARAAAERVNKTNA